MSKRKKTIALSLALAIALSPARPAAAFGFGDFSGIANSLFGELGKNGVIDKGLQKNLELYTKLGSVLVSAFRAKSLKSLVSILPLIGELTKGNGSTSQCSENGGGACDEDMDEMIGEAGALDWGAIAEKVDEAVKASVSESDKIVASSEPGVVSPGITDTRFRVRLPIQQRHIKDASFVDLQQSQTDVLLGADGQKFLAEDRKSDADIVKQSSETTAKIQSMENTQDVLKANALNDTLSLALLQKDVEQGRQGVISSWEGNRIESKQLGYQQQEAWRGEVVRSFERQDAFIGAQQFAGFIDSAAVDPGKPYEASGEN